MDAVSNAMSYICSCTNILAQEKPLMGSDAIVWFVICVFHSKNMSQ